MELTLDLVLKGKWYDMIESGEKPEEYRNIIPFWCNRLLLARPCPHGFDFIRKSADWWDHKLNMMSKSELACQIGNLIDFQKYDQVTFHRGYTNRTMTFEIGSMMIGTGNPNWGAEEGNEYFVIRLGKRI